MDIIEIKNLEIFANHGVFPEENVLGQKFVVSAKLYTSTRKAGLTDDLTASIHYGEVSQMLTKFTKEHTYKLLETLAENLCQMLLHEFPLMNAITLRIEKPWAPVGLPLDTVAVEITRGWHTLMLPLAPTSEIRRNISMMAFRVLRTLRTAKSKLYQNILSQSHMEM